MESVCSRELDRPTIETILKGVNGVKRLGDVRPSDSVPCPVRGIDVVDSLCYILEADIVGSFIKYLNSCEGDIRSVKREYAIPIADRTVHGWGTPKIFFHLSLDKKCNIHGNLYHEYEGKHTIMDFPEIPKYNPSKI